MGYTCPVCTDPQADDRHLANHIAFTAITGDTAHEEWLDDHVPDWGSMGESELADLVVEYADETEYPQVFEDTTDQGHDHHHEQDRPQGSAGQRGSRSLSEGDREVLAEARDLTRQMLDEDESDGSDADEATGDETE
ncbi:DUF5810 domain-containing protein [Haloarcula halophila]|uniref:DUF5810 domain-containing protein n=1 Tax=Haloarcula TaxID=2237 RepID=UPI0023E416A7|nr:DUF5810 domain-containing protein [Halomicroarcula sp. DFY41]